MICKNIFENRMICRKNAAFRVIPFTLALLFAALIGITFYTRVSDEIFVVILFTVLMAELCVLYFIEYIDFAKNRK